MAVFPGTYIKTGVHSNERVNAIIDNILTPRMVPFRQVHQFDEEGVLMADGETWNFVYSNWNEDYPTLVWKNGNKLESTSYTIDYLNGRIDAGTVDEYDGITASYCFDYFPSDTLAGYIIVAIDTINSAAAGPPTSYDISDAPTGWDAVIADLAFAMAMERLLLEYETWKGRLSFPINGLEDQGSASQTIETLKNNSEERAYRALDNPKFKSGNLLSTPTQYYYHAVRGVGRSGTHIASGNYGKRRGWKRNKYF